MRLQPRYMRLGPGYIWLQPPSPHLGPGAEQRQSQRARRHLRAATHKYKYTHALQKAVVWKCRSILPYLHARTYTCIVRVRVHVHVHALAHAHVHVDAHVHVWAEPPWHRPSPRFALTRRIAVLGPRGSKVQDCSACQGGGRGRGRGGGPRRRKHGKKEGRWRAGETGGGRYLVTQQVRQANK